MSNMNSSQGKPARNTTNSLNGYIPHERIQPLNMMNMLLNERVDVGDASRNMDAAYNQGRAVPPSLLSSTTMPSSSASYQSPYSIQKDDWKKRDYSKMKLPFPWKLHQLLEDLEYEGRQDIASWLPGGTSFRVHKPGVFSEEIMSNYFRQTKFASFVRQLYIYGFSKIESGPEVGAYHHPSFLRDQKTETLSLGRNQIEKDRRCKSKQRKGTPPTAATLLEEQRKKSPFLVASALFERNTSCSGRQTDRDSTNTTTSAAAMKDGPSTSTRLDIHDSANTPNLLVRHDYEEQMTAKNRDEKEDDLDNATSRSKLHTTTNNDDSILFSPMGVKFLPSRISAAMGTNAAAYTACRNTAATNTSVDNPTTTAARGNTTSSSDLEGGGSPHSGLLSSFLDKYLNSSTAFLLEGPSNDLFQIDDLEPRTIEEMTSSSSSIRPTENHS